MEELVTLAWNEIGEELNGAAVPADRDMEMALGIGGVRAGEGFVPGGDLIAIGVGGQFGFGEGGAAEAAEGFSAAPGDLRSEI